MLTLLPLTHYTIHSRKNKARYCCKIYMCNGAGSNPVIRSIQPIKPYLSHVTVFFLWTAAQEVMSLLHHDCNAFGQKINLGKSSVFLVRGAQTS